MASANMELVRSIYAAWARGDFSSTDWAHPEIEYERADGPSPGSWTGLPGMAQGWHDFLSSWADLSIEADEFRELDSERLLVLSYFSGRGKKSGPEVRPFRAKAASVFHFRGGKVIRLVQYADHRRALADLGVADEFGP